MKGLLEVIVSAWNGERHTSKTIPSNVSIHTQVLEFDNVIARDKFRDTVVKRECIGNTIDVTRKFYEL